MKLLKTFWTDQSGQGLTEYASIVALVSVALILVLVAFRDEFGMGLDMEPQLGIPDEATWIARWTSLAAGYALMPLDEHRKFVAAGVPMRVLATDARRVLVTRR